MLELPDTTAYVEGLERHVLGQRLLDRLAICAVFLAAGIQVGCSKDSQLGWLTSLGGSIIFGGLKWAVAGALFGFILAVVGYWILLRSGAIAATGSVAKVVRFVVLMVQLVVVPVGFAYVGFFEGVLRASAYELSEGEFAEEYFPVVGGAGADLIGTVLLSGDLSSAMSDAPPDEIETLTAAFRSGEREIEASQIPVLISAIDGEYVGRISDDIKSKAQETFPILSEGRGKQILDWLMDNCSDALVRTAIEGGLERKGLGSVLDLFGDMIRRLPDAATRHEDPEKLSHRELSAFIVEVTIADGVVRFVVKPLCRAQQIGAMIPVLVLLALPVVLLRSPGLVLKLVSRFSTGDEEPAAEERPEAGIAPRRRAG